MKGGDSTPSAVLVQLLEDEGEVFTDFTGRFTDILELFTTEPLLILLLGIMVVGAIIGLVMRVVNRR